MNIGNNHAAIITASDNSHIPTSDAHVSVQDDSGGWHGYLAAHRGTAPYGVSAWAVAPFCSTRAAVCYGVGRSPESLFCGAHFVTTSGVSSVVLQVDSLDQERLVYQTSDKLIYTWHDGATWSQETVMSGGVASLGGLVLDQADNPIVAFLSSSGQPWLARRVVGVTEGSVGGVRAAASATVIRSMLVLPVSAARAIAYGVLLDASGRKVMDLASGPNDVSGLAPGVYFVREAQAQAQAQAVHKVVIAR